MFWRNRVRFRQVCILVCLLCIVVLNLVIVGTVSVNGMLNNQERCSLYFRAGASATSDNGFCAMPAVSAAILATVGIVFASHQTIVVCCRQDAYHLSPRRRWSAVLLGFSILAALVSFGMCVEIAVGIQIACKHEEVAAAKEGDTTVQQNCRSRSPFPALFVAQVCAGILGGLWVIVANLEWFQYRSRPGPLQAVVGPASRDPAVIPHTSEANTVDHWHEGGLHHIGIPVVRPSTMSTNAPE